MMKNRQDKGISTVAGTILLIVLIFIIQVALFIAILKSNAQVQEGLRIEAERLQEKLVLFSIQTSNSTGNEYVTAIRIDNSGSITIRIRAIYINGDFLCDPSDPSINPGDTYINAKEVSQWIYLPSGVQYNPSSKITAATERGTKTTEYEAALKTGVAVPPNPASEDLLLGPLMLDFTEFYYAKVDSNGNQISEWIPGWSIDSGTRDIVWNITVKNVDKRNITINQFSVFTLVPNDSPSSRRPWYITFQPNQLSMLIMSNQTVNLIYKWSTPLMNQTRYPNLQDIYNTRCRCRVFLTFFGIFHENDGTTKPYGQTIPFEAVLVEHVPIVALQITAAPTVLPTNSTLNSLVEAILLQDSVPMTGQNITFTSTSGIILPGWVLTNVNGSATTLLSSSMSPTNITVTASWNTISSNTTVRFTNLYVTTNVTTYSPNATVGISGLLRTLSGSPVENTTISINITNLEGVPIWEIVSDPTDIQGAFSYNLILLNAQVDRYIVKVEASVNGQLYREEYWRFNILEA